jgi:hypothetical protein
MTELPLTLLLPLLLGVKVAVGTGELIAVPVDDLNVPLKISILCKSPLTLGNGAHKGCAGGSVSSEMEEVLPTVPEAVLRFTIRKVTLEEVDGDAGLEAMGRH